MINVYVSVITLIVWYVFFAAHPSPLFCPIHCGSGRAWLEPLAGAGRELTRARGAAFGRRSPSACRSCEAFEPAPPGARRCRHTDPARPERWSACAPTTCAPVRAPHAQQRRAGAPAGLLGRSARCPGARPRSRRASAPARRSAARSSPAAVSVGLSRSCVGARRLGGVSTYSAAATSRGSHARRRAPRGAASAAIVADRRGPRRDAGATNVPLPCRLSIRPSLLQALVDGARRC